MEFKKGNIGDAPEKLIIHGCNAQGAMGSGVANIIRYTFHGAYLDYQREHQLGLLTPGYVHFYKVNEDKFIGNMITQESCGSDGRKYASYTALVKCLTRVAEFAKVHDIDRIATVPVGCGLGGLKREIVFELFKEFEEEQADYGIKLVVYDL